jgi:hypothetical protein
MLRDGKEYTLRHIQKSEDAKCLYCSLWAAKAQVTLDDASIPAHLHLVARVFWPVLDVEYTLSQEDVVRVIAWIAALPLALYA